MKFSDTAEGFAYFESFANFEQTGSGAARTFRLDRMEYLLNRFGDPQASYSSIHLAGSKGKGSTAAFAAGILKAAGLKTGLYTSPHVASYKERITEAGDTYPDELYLRWLNRIAEQVSRLTLPGGEEPTTFELLTLLAHLMFRDLGIEWGIIETGLGGRLDATNVLLPRASVFTPIELEHTDVLGDTLQLIAEEKSGIIKKGVPAYSAVQEEEVCSVLLKKAAAKESEILFLNKSGYSLESSLSTAGTRIKLDRNNLKTLKAELPLLGDFQAWNASLAVLVLDSLAGKGILPELDSPIIGKGLESAKLPGRMEIIRRDPPVILDGAHTPLSVKKAADCFTSLFKGERILLFGSVQGKDAKNMAGILAPNFTEIIVTTPGSFKKSEPEEVYREFVKINGKTRYIPNTAEAVRTAQEMAGPDIPVLITGSFYLAGEARKYL